MVSSPAAETVETNRPAPRSSQSGSSAWAARTWAIRLTSQEVAQVFSSRAPSRSPSSKATPALAQ